MTRQFPILLCLGVAVATTGCVGPEMQSHTATPHPTSQLPLSLVVDDFQFVPTPSQPQTTWDPEVNGEGDAADRQLFADALEDDIDGNLVGEARNVLPPRDLGEHGVASPGFEVQYRVLHYDIHPDPYPPEATALIVAGVLTGGLLALPVGQIRHGSTHTLYVEMRLYDVRGAPLLTTTDPSTGNQAHHYDLAAAPIVARRRYWIEMRSDTSVTATPSGLDEDHFVRAQAAELARRVVDTSLPDLTRGLEAGLALPPPRHGDSDAPQPRVPAMT